MRPRTTRWRAALAATTFAQVARDLVGALVHGGLIDTAAQLAYWNVLAVFPFGIMALALCSFLPLHGIDAEVVKLVHEVMPPAIAQLCVETLREVVGEQRAWSLLLALLGALWTASRSVKSAMVSLNQIWGAMETRSYGRAKGIAIGLTLAATVMLMIGAVAMMLGPVLGVGLLPGVSALPGPVLQAGRWLVVCAIMMTISSLCYRLLPNLGGRTRFVVPGAIFATVLWLAVSAGFTTYVAHFSAHARIYGALGGGFVLVSSIYLAGLVLLLGAVVNVRFDRSAQLARTRRKKR